MKARCLGTAVLALALLLAVVPVALAKGASAATIKGPGLDRPISLRGLGEPGADTKLAKLSDQAGLFVAMFGDNGVAGQLAGAPPGDLGPRYTITYAVPGDGGRGGGVHGGRRPDRARHPPPPERARSRSLSRCPRVVHNPAETACPRRSSLPRWCPHQGGTAWRTRRLPMILPW